MPVKSSAGRPAVERVVRGLGATENAEEADEERQRRPHPRPRAAVPDRDSRKHRQRREAADEMVGRRGARLRLQEAVVDDVDRDDGDRARRQHTLGGDAGPHVAVGPPAGGLGGCLAHADAAGAGGASTLSTEPRYSRCGAHGMSTSLTLVAVVRSAT